MKHMNLLNHTGIKSMCSKRLADAPVVYLAALKKKTITTALPRITTASMLCYVLFGILRRLSQWVLVADPRQHPHSIPCGHIFCRSCLVNVESSNCPLCRTAFDRERIKKLHVDARSPTQSAISSTASPSPSTRQ
ncbi:hypothetical protein B0H13DRAFT_263741 [Mycena leptocephala]|nr:hypothetical protein B0H13DRAFT_263741 [Mycena leptocephala]